MRRRHTKITTEAALTHTTPLKVRFSEVDSMHVVWHGEYVRYFEDGREAFGEHFSGLAYLDIYASGYTLPIVEMSLEYKLPLHIAERARIEARYIPSEAAKICFEYIIRRDSDSEVVAVGWSTQVFVDAAGELQLSVPDFFKQWKQRWGVQ